MVGRRDAVDVVGAIDLADNDAFVERVPYEWFDALRRDDPVHWQTERAGRGFWAVTTHADVVRVSNDWETFSSQAGASALEDLAPDALEARRSMIDTDPPLHADLRRLVSGPFRPRSIGDYEELVRSITRDVLHDALAEGCFDLVERIATPIPIKVLCRLLGVPGRGRGPPGLARRPVDREHRPRSDLGAPRRRRRASAIGCCPSGIRPRWTSSSTAGGSLRTDEHGPGRI